MLFHRSFKDKRLRASMRAVSAFVLACALAAPAAAEYQVPVMRLVGEWQTPFGTMDMEVESFEGSALARISEPSTGARYMLWRHPGDRGETDGGANFYWSADDGRCRAFVVDCAGGRLSLRLSQDGRRLEATTISGRPLQGSQRWSGTRLRNDTAAERRLAHWLGEWDSPNGPIRFRVEGKVLVGEFQMPRPGGVVERGVVAMFPGGWGAWDLPGASSPQRGRADLTMSPDRTSFSGTLTYSREDDPGAPTTPLALTGRRRAAGGEQTPPAGPVAQPAPAPPPVEAPPAPAPAPSGAFQPLNRVDVRVDRVAVARGYPTHQVHAFVTVRNTSGAPVYFTSGFVKAFLADADGAGWERSQPYRASGEPAELFASTPVIQPGGELRVRYIFLSEPDARLSSLTLSEGTTRAEFRVTGF